MRFAEAGAAVDEQRVAIGEEGTAGDALGGGEGFVVGGRFDEVVKLVVADEVAFKRRRGGSVADEQVGRACHFHLYFFDALVAEEHLQRVEERGADLLAGEFVWREQYPFFLAFRLEGERAEDEVVFLGA